MKDYQRLIKNLIGLSLLVSAGFAIYFLFIRENNPELEIDSTPIHIESIKTIAEVSTVSYKDEVVIDTIEYYSGTTNIYNPFEWGEIYDKALNRNIKRRMTLIFRGEVRYGLDLTNDNYSIRQNEDSLWIEIPSPVILDIIITPEKTEVFQEQGNWSDGERKVLEAKAKIKFAKNAENLNLRKKAVENSEKLLSKLIQTNKKLIISFED